MGSLGDSDEPLAVGCVFLAPQSGQAACREGGDPGQGGAPARGPGSCILTSLSERRGAFPALHRQPGHVMSMPPGLQPPPPPHPFCAWAGCFAHLG